MSVSRRVGSATVTVPDCYWFVGIRATTDTPEITEEQWAHLKRSLAQHAQPTRHSPTPWYQGADHCPHPIKTTDQPEGLYLDEWPTDGVHVWGGEDGDVLICLESPIGEGCEECNDERCRYWDADVVAERRADAWIDLFYWLGMDS